MMPIFKSNKEKYLFHLEEVKKFDGFATEYCRLHNLKRDLLSYYKKKSSPKAVGQFVQVKVKSSNSLGQLRADSAINIDPAWLAKLIHNLVKIK